MPDLMINPTPTPPPSGTGSANALGPGDAAGRSGESAKQDTASGSTSPFAAVLKSQVDKKSAAADAANNANSAAATAQADTEDESGTVDLSALFPFLGANPAKTTSPTSVSAVPQATTEQAAAALDETLLPGLEAAASSPPTQVLAALPAVDTTPSTQKVGAKEEPFTSAGRAKPGDTAQAAGKIALDAAINADVSRKAGEVHQAEIPASDFNALLERAIATPPGAAASANGSAASPSLRIDTPLGQKGWHDEVGQKLTWMVGNNRQQADLVLNPPQLGRVEVSLTMNGDQATAIFTSANPAVREALESSLHRLREVLADAGVSLGQTQVGSESPRQSGPGNELDPGRNQGMRYASTIPLPGVAAVARTGIGAGRGMIDIFA